MSFGFSVGDLLLAVNILWDVGQALSETEGAKKLVTGDILFLEHLKGTMEDVNEAIEDSLVSKSLKDNIKAIWEPVVETKVEIVSYMELTADGTGDLKNIISRFYKKIKYCQRFSEKIAKLRDKVAVPLLGLHMSLTIIGLGKLRTNQETLEEWVAGSKRNHDEGLLHKVKEWLQPVSSVEDTYHVTIHHLLPGTCDWLFSKQEYIDWYNNYPKKRSPLLWISGIPGAGKTNLAAKLIQRLTQDKRTVAYFFCDGTDQRSNIRSVLTTICWELLNQFPEDIDILSEIYHKGGEPTETDMRGCLGRMCERRSTIILLDGLDECTLDKRRKLCEFLASSTSLSDVVVFSRELEDIEQGLNQEPHHIGMAHISISESDTRNDLKRFITQEATRFDVSDQETRREIVRRLHVGCQGMFQWAAQMIEHLVASQCMFEDELLSKTEEMPKGLHDLYKNILSNIHKDQSEKMRENSMSILYWVALAGRALSLQEIAMMLRVKDGAPRHGNATMAVQSRLRKTISDYCGSLVRFTKRGKKDIVIVAHASVKEFLLGRAERQILDPMNQTEAEIEAELAEICLKYLCFDDIRFPPFQIAQINVTWLSLVLSFRQYLERHPLMDYATTYAWRHASLSAMSPKVQIVIKQFCSSETITVRWLQTLLQIGGKLGT